MNLLEFRVPERSTPPHGGTIAVQRMERAFAAFTVTLPLPSAAA